MKIWVYQWKASLKYTLLAMLLSCTQNKMDAEGTLETFIVKRLGNEVSREFILERVTGKMKEGLQNISDEDFKAFVDLSNYQKTSFKILSKSCQKERCFLTYKLNYTSQTSDEENSNVKTEVKKIAELVYEEGKWLIADVVNVKTYHESLTPITP